MHDKLIMMYKAWLTLLPETAKELVYVLADNKKENIILATSS